MRTSRYRFDSLFVWLISLTLAALAVRVLLAEEPAQDKHTPIDPVRLNGPIFADWPKPDVALLFSGEMDGYMEPCGCAGLDNQKGGLKRRHSLIKQLQADGWPVVALDLGELVNRFGPQAEIKYRYTLASLVQMGYAAVGIGPSDLRLDLLSIVINLEPAKNPLVSANVGILNFDSGFTHRYKIVEAGGMKIGVTAVLGKKQLAAFQNSEELTLLEPAEALRQVLPDLQTAGCDQLVLMSFADPDESKQLARQFPEFNWVVTALGAEEPPNQPSAVEGTSSHLIEVGHKGMYAAVVGLYKSGPTPFRYQRVPLDSRFGDSAEMQALFTAYQHDLETMGLEGLGVKAVPHPSGRKFAGSATCADCHTAATEVFEKSAHAHATDTLAHLNPPRNFDPECLSCHVTGWDPQRFFPYTSGYISLQATPALVGNGCENCHGPAARHAAAESGEIDVDEQELKQLRQALHLQVVDNEGNKDRQAYGSVVQMCMQCHDLDNSPAFDFQHYWPEVEHHGKD
jgi:Cytochrome c554 and c-prime